MPSPMMAAWIIRRQIDLMRLAWNLEKALGQVMPSLFRRSFLKSLTI